MENKIKEVRKQKNMTQEQLASAIGVTRSVISKYESGSIPLTIEQYWEIADALGVKLIDIVPTVVLDAFFSGFNKAIETRRIKLAETEEEAEEAEDDVLQLLHCFDDLDTVGQKKAITLLREMSGLPPLNEDLGINEKERKRSLNDSFDALNYVGQRIAVERVEELTEIPKYQKKEPDGN